MNPIKKTTEDFMGILIYQGITFILFAVLIFIYPEIMNYAVAMVFLIVGLECCIYSFRIKRNYKKAESFWKNFDESDNSEEVE